MTANVATPCEGFLSGEEEVERKRDQNVKAPTAKREMGMPPQYFSLNSAEYGLYIAARQASAESVTGRPGNDAAVNVVEAAIEVLRVVEGRIRAEQQPRSDATSATSPETLVIYVLFSAVRASQSLARPGKCRGTAAAATPPPETRG